jgi:hypothetical protein
MPIHSKRWPYAIWLVLICGFAALHALHLSADFPNHSPWFSDAAKYTDEGWWANAAIRAHLTGNWYLQNDYNPAVAVPVWPFLEWVLFFFTGVGIEAARGLSVGFFLINLLLSFFLLRTRGPLWMALLALTVLVTSPFFYCFSRLAILEQLLITLMLAALYLATRLPRLRHPLVASLCIGLLFTLMMLTKTTSLFLAPALGWAIVCSFWQERKVAFRLICAAVGSFGVSISLWMALVVSSGKFHDFRNVMLVNTNMRWGGIYWPFYSLAWEVVAAWRADHVFVLVALVAVLGTALTWRNGWGGKLLLDPVFGASILAIAGYLLFLFLYGHAQLRHFAVLALFSIFIVVQAAHAALGEISATEAQQGKQLLIRRGMVALFVLIAGINGIWTLKYATHPEYTFINAARQLTQYIDDHPNGNRLLVSDSGDEITLATQLPSRCDTVARPCSWFPDKAARFALYQPGWYATWNKLDHNVLADIHAHFSIEQVASYSVYDEPNRNLLVLFKLHPLPYGLLRDPDAQNLRQPLPGDKIEIPIQ